MEQGVHLRRDRAESFGSIAADYDRYRPSYPPPLIDDLVALRPDTVLDVGCGTGKAATLLAARGLTVLGVEPDPAMAAVARTHGIHVEVGHFETWPDAGRRFDLITCAQAWHWVDPAVGPSRAAQLLRPDGTLALFWNYDDLEQRAQDVVDRVYTQHAPELLARVGNGGGRHDRQAFVRDLADSGAFDSVGTHTYGWERAAPVESWLRRVGTQSEHLLLGPQRLTRLLDALREALSDTGPQIHSTGGTYTIRASGPRA